MRSLQVLRDLFLRRGPRDPVKVPSRPWHHPATAGQNHSCGNATQAAVDNKNAEPDHFRPGFKNLSDFDVTRNNETNKLLPGTSRFTNNRYWEYTHRIMTLLPFGGKYQKIEKLG